ncbi:MAG TPA: hypothetical protein VGE45_06265 [Chloroflexia bacterium]|jgi:hypothetical protein
MPDKFGGFLLNDIHLDITKLRQQHQIDFNWRRPRDSAQSDDPVVTDGGYSYHLD